MGRPKKTVVLVFAEADYKAFAETEKLYTNKSNIQTRTRVIREFLSSCDVNNLGLGPALRPWVGAQRRSGVAWSSLDTFCGYIYGTLAGRINLSDVPEWDNICSVVAAAHADSTTKSALTATDAQLRQLKEIPTCTTYSFRHLYIKNVLAYCPSSTRCTVVRTFWPPTRIGQLDGIQHKV
jgi:hypothetical protein